MVTEFVKLSDEFDKYKKICIKGQFLGVARYLDIRT